MTWLKRRPKLRKPTMVVSFKGWNDAADVASNAVAWMRNRWDAQLVGEIGSEPFYDLQSTRPIVRVVDGVVQEVRWPITEIWSASPPDAETDVLFVVGPEPNFRWRQFCQELLETGKDVGCERIITVGALLADTPHTRPVRLIGTASESEIIEQVGLQPSSYQGPTGVIGVLNAECREAGIPSMSLWAPVPHYLANPPNPKATRALLGKVPELLGTTIDLHELDMVATAWERQINQAVADDTEITAYVHQLEERADANESLEPWSAKTLVSDLERYLRDQPNPD